VCFDLYVNVSMYARIYVCACVRMCVGGWVGGVR